MHTCAMHVYTSTALSYSVNPELYEVLESQCIYYHR